jgi:hypothetical protein
MDGSGQPEEQHPSTLLMRCAERMGSTLVHAPNQMVTIHANGSLFSGFVNGRPPVKVAHVTRQNLSAWFYGEILPPKRLSGNCIAGGVSFSHYQSGTLRDFMRIADGWFAFAIHDLNSNTLLLGNDRHGF